MIKSLLQKQFISIPLKQIEFYIQNEVKFAFKASLILVFLLFNNVSNLFSQSKLAILIGNQNYLHVSSLKTPIPEIDTLAKICNANGFKTLVYKNIPLVEYNLMFDSIEKVIDQSSFLYIHYAGHGVQLDGENYIVPIDAHPNTITQAERQCVQVDNFIKLIKDYQFSHDIKSLICFDACRDNPFKQIDGNIDVGFKKIDYSPINTGIIYSCAAGKTALDGKKDYSPFAKVWISQIQNCNLSINEICAMIDGELLKLGMSEDRLPERQFIGLSSVYFCSKDKFNEVRNYESKLILLNNLKDNMDLDFANRNYTSVIGKCKWIDSLLSNNEALKQNIPFEDYLRIKYLESKSYFEINDLVNSEKGFEALWSLINNKNTPEDFIYDTYFYLGRLYSLKKKWNEIKSLRRQFLTYSKSKGNTLDVITTYDKIAGDYEGESQFDSANFYYNLSFKEAEIFSINTTYEASCIASFYNNKGKFHVWQKDPIRGLESLLKAYNLFIKYNLSTYYVLYDLADFYINYKACFSGDSAVRYLAEYKIATNLNTLIERLNYLSLDFELMIQLKNQDSIKAKLEMYYNELNKLLDLQVVHETEGFKKFESLCEVPYWNLSFMLPKNVYPIIFLDKNLNDEYDNQDLILTPDIQKSESNSALEIAGQNINEPNLVIYQENFQIPNSGIVNLKNNIPDDYFNLTTQNNLVNSIAEFKEVGNYKEWNFTIYFSDIGKDSKVKYFIGGMNLQYENNFLIKHSDKLTISPAKQGAKYICNILLNN